MTKNDWYEAGDQIKKLVQDAVDSKDFSQLSGTITNVVNETVNGLQEALRENLSQNPKGAQRAEQEKSAQNRDRHPGSRKNGSYRKNPFEYTNREAAERIRRNMQQKRQREKTEQKDRVNAPVKVKLKVPGELSGNFMKWIGYSMSGVFGLALMIFFIVMFSLGFGMGGAVMMIPTGVMGILFGTSFLIGTVGKNRSGLARRFRRYKEIMGDRTYCLVEELAASVGRSCKSVSRDLKKMISLGFFREGYLDRKETLLITDRSTYQQYLTTQAEYERRSAQKTFDAQQVQQRRDEERLRAQAEKSGQKEAFAGKYAGKAGAAALSPECREIIEEGQRYIVHIRTCNDRIDEQEFSAKLDRLELVISRIFLEVEKNPDAADELKKMMSYYLPTTKKLLDAYCELSEQPISGQNIENTKQEIEKALDTINAAFERLLDSFFEEKAWDISSDITVLQNMLAQEGLTGRDFS